MSSLTVMSLQWIVMWWTCLFWSFLNTTGKDTGTSYDDIETRGTVPVGLFWGQSLGRSWNQIMWYCWHFSLVSGPPKKELWWMSSKECLTVKPEATAVDCVLNVLNIPSGTGLCCCHRGFLQHFQHWNHGLPDPYSHNLGSLQIQLRHTNMKHLQ